MLASATLGELRPGCAERWCTCPLHPARSPSIDNEEKKGNKNPNKWLKGFGLLQYLAQIPPSVQFE